MKNCDKIGKYIVALTNWDSEYQVFLEIIRENDFDITFGTKFPMCNNFL